MSDHDDDSGSNSGHGYTDFDGRPRELAAESAAPTSPTTETRPLPTIAPAPVAPPADPPRVTRTARKPRFATLAVVLALLIGLVAGGVGGGLAGYELRGGGQPAQAASSPVLAQNVVTDTAPNSGSPTTGTASLSDLVARVNPAIVTIEGQVSQTDPFGQTASGTQTGSGYIIDTAGHIVTNNHVIEGATSLKVTFSDGRQVDATLVAGDPFQDVAVLKIDGAVPATIAFGDSDQVRAGDSVIAIGSALGEFKNSVTNGIVSGTGRSLDTGQGYRLGNLIQHNASISPGNSGGPLLNTQGEVIGMNTAVVRGGNSSSAEGLGFAIASNTVKQVAQELIQNGQANYPYIGVQFANAAGAAATTPGATNAPVVLTQVTAGGPAAKAGLKAGDIITAVDGTQVTDEQPFLNLVFAHKPGDTAQFTVTRRNGQQETISVILGERPQGQ